MIKLPFIRKAIILLAFASQFNYAQSQTSSMTTQLPYHEALVKANALLAQMTADEKILLIGGVDYFYSQAIPRLGIPRIMMTDATGGVHLRDEFMDMKYTRPMEKSTAFPAPIALAATWNRQLAHDYAKSIGEECRVAGIPVLLGPGMNIYRISQCGRNFEYMGEDPYLSGQMVANYVQGMQSTGTIATLKHFVANNTDFFRRKSNSIVDERTLNEIYIPAFKAGIDAGARAVMTSYNQLNGEWCGQSSAVITDLLRKKLGFQWLVMTDWWSVYNGEKLVNSGQGLEMPSSFATKDVKKMLDEGEIQMTQIDDMVRQQLVAFISMGTYDYKPDASLLANFPKHEETALQTEREAIVLLKNNGILPLKPKQPKILLTGYFLDEVLQGGGSALVDGYNLVPLAMAMKAQFGKSLTISAKASDKQLAKAEVVILNIGTVDSEGYDRPFELPAKMETYIKHVLSINPNTIISINSGSGIRMTDWADKAAAILYCWYPGQNGTKALAEVLAGKTNPSGKLPMTIEREFSETVGVGYMNNEHFYVGWNSEGEKAHPLYDLPYTEGIFVGYRWFDAKKIAPQFPFGHGLSYTSFEYGPLSAKPLADNQVLVTFTLTNTGKVAGSEVAQIYVRDIESSVCRPEKELKQFAKVTLQPGQSQTIEVVLPVNAFKFYDDTKHDWVLEPGKFEIWVGASSRDIRQKVGVEL
jgi:beta-glucosidase